MKLSDIFDVSSSPSSLGNRFRNKRFYFFLEKIAFLPKPIRIVDIGGLESFWDNHGFANDNDYQITLLNLTSCATNASNIRSIAADGTNLNTISNKAYDISFSNSVIEHVYTKENQLKMANEIRRIGRYYFVQTPNKHFPIEPHYLLPFFQYFPNKIQYNILTKTRLSRLHRWDSEYAKQYIEEIRLLTYKEIKELFPDCTIYKEKIGEFVKSFTAHNLP